MLLGGRFRTARAERQLFVVYPWNTPEGHPPTEACMTNSKQHVVQNSGPWDPWLLVAENSRLFAQRTVRPVRQGCTCTKGGGGWGTQAYH